MGPYEFPVVAVTNDHSLSCFKKCKLTAFVPEVRSLRSVSLGKVWVCRGWLLEAQGWGHRDYIIFPFQLLGVPLVSHALPQSVPLKGCSCHHVLLP